MRSLSFLVALLAAAPLAAAEAYRWVDRDGVVHYSDQPAPGAQKIPLTIAPRPGSVAPPPPAASPRNPESTASTATRAAHCAFTSPAPDQVFQAAETVPVSLQVEPSMDAGDRVSVALNGATVEQWPSTATSMQLGPMPRGAYTLAATVTAADGSVKCAAATVAFNVFQPSVLSPGRKRTPR